MSIKEIQSIITKYDDLKASKLRMALATVIHVEDSAYRRSGARMLIIEDGTWIGGISGGCLEGDTLTKAQHAISENKIVKVSYDTRENDPNQIGVGLGCNGLIEILITPISSQNSKPIDVLRKCIDNRTPTILVTDLKTGLVYHNEETTLSDSPLQAQINEVKTRRKSLKIAHDYFIEFIPPSISLYIYGSNYDVIPLINIAKAIGWNCHLICNPTKISKSLYQSATTVVNQNNIPLAYDDYSVALLMSHDYNKDKAYLSTLHQLSLRYIGILGPKKRSLKMIEEFKKEGIQIDLTKLYSPIGLDTGATSPEEIAISIIAEIRTYFSDRSGGHLRDREGAIHQS